MSNDAIIDICQRVFGANIDVEVASSAGGVIVWVRQAKCTDSLTRSQQEMDVILSLQHLLQGVAIDLRVVS
jgi:hypothetical protein